VGGGYGAKLTRSAHVAAACALAACSLNKAVRFLLPLESCMVALGLRNRTTVDYEVRVRTLYI
jgi:Xanthine dehydrogenase, molybdopterin-binding subunit B